MDDYVDIGLGLEGENVEMADGSSSRTSKDWETLMLASNETSEDSRDLRTPQASVRAFHDNPEDQGGLHTDNDELFNSSLVSFVRDLPRFLSPQISLFLFSLLRNSNTTVFSLSAFSLLFFFKLQHSSLFEKQ